MYNPPKSSGPGKLINGSQIIGRYHVFHIRYSRIHEISTNTRISSQDHLLCSKGFIWFGIMPQHLVGKLWIGECSIYWDIWYFQTKVRYGVFFKENLNLRGMEREGEKNCIPEIFSVPARYFKRSITFKE